MELLIVHIQSEEMNKDFEQEFDEYIKKFDMNIKQIRFKYYHSYEVEHLMKKLSIMLKLSEEKTNLACVIGLLHDIGRFPQIQDYGICSDTKTGVNHATLGTNYLFKENHIIDFYDKREHYEIIKDAIDNHNKYEIDKNITGDNLLFSKMIRDMDKIDIYRVISEEYEYTYDKEEITKEVLEEFNNNRCVVSRLIKTKTDSIYSFLGFIYDINFNESFKILKETNYLNILLDKIKVKENSVKEFNLLREKVNNYVDKMIKD